MDKERGLWYNNEKELYNYMRFLDIAFGLSGMYGNRKIGPFV